MQAVLLPGLDGTGALHEPFQAALPFRCMVLSYPPDLTRYDALRPWVAAQLPLSPYLLIAESYSGPLALMLAEQGLPGIRGLVFVASFARRPRPAPAWMATSLRAAPVKNHLSSRLMQPFVMGGWSNATFTKTLWQALQTVPAATLSERLKQVLKIDARTAFAALDLPMLYLQASSDRVVPPRAGRDFTKAGAALRVIDGPHFLLQANPRGAADAIAQFATQL